LASCGVSKSGTRREKAIQIDRTVRYKLVTCIRAYMQSIDQPTTNNLFDYSIVVTGCGWYLLILVCEDMGHVRINTGTQDVDVRAYVHTYLLPSSTGTV
jgi:hypothetical protein